MMPDTELREIEESQTLPGRTAAAPGPPRRLPGDRVMVLLVTLLVAFLWGRGRGIWYWLDEGLSVGISSHSLAHIPMVLRLDGSPPLYYILLHCWIAIFGNSESSTHVLSLIFAVATVPTAFWAGRSLFGRRTGWFFALMMAINPFVGLYANETRMYSLVALLALVATAAFLHVFAFRRRRYLPLFTVALALLLYTHNWGLFFGLGAGAALIVAVVVDDDRRRVFLDGVLGFGAAGLLYLPWVPTLLYQRSHTGAPASMRPTLLIVRDDIASLIGGRDGGREVVVALALGAGIGLVVLLRWPWGKVATAVVVAAVIPVVAIAFGWALSRDASVWAFRYLAVGLPSILLILAVGLARGGRLAVAALCVTAFFTAPVGEKRPPYQKSNLREVAQTASPKLRSGDLVVSPDFAEVPLLVHYLEPGLRYADTAGPISDVNVSDQRDSTTRLRVKDPRITLTPLLDAVSVGGHVLLVCPPILAPTPDQTDFIKLIFQRCAQVEAMLVGNPRYRLLISDEASPGVMERPVNGYLLEKAR